MNEYQERLEHIITISKIKDFDQLNSKQCRELALLRVGTHMPVNEMHDCVECMSEEQLSALIKSVARWTYQKGADNKSKTVDNYMVDGSEAAVEAWGEAFEEDIERDFYAMLNKITEDDAERRADRSMAEGV